MSIDQIKSSFGIDEFEIVRTGYGGFPALTVFGTAGQYGSGEAITTIAHNLGYTPALAINIAAVQTGTTAALPCPYENNNLSATSGIWGILQAYADQTNIYLLSDLMVYGATNGVIAAGTFTAQYYLLKERIKRLV